MTRVTREWRTGRIQRRRVSGRAKRRSRVIGAPRASSGAATIVSRTCWTMWSLKRVVSYASIGDWRASSMTARPSSQATIRPRGTRLLGCAASTERTAHR
jgi:hypothetical protein